VTVAARVNCPRRVVWHREDLHGLSGGGGGAVEEQHAADLGASTVLDLEFALPDGVQEERDPFDGSAGQRCSVAEPAAPDRSRRRRGSGGPAVRWSFVEAGATSAASRRLGGRCLRGRDASGEGRRHPPF
jgi:hypothetical protein